MKNIVLILCLLFIACDKPVRSVPFHDDFSRDELGNYWDGNEDFWQIKQGKLSSERALNSPLWLRVALPQDVEISFTALSKSKAVDLKCEVFGDGDHHESGYIVILGGWNNSTSIIARLDEHGHERTKAKTLALQHEVNQNKQTSQVKYTSMRERISKPVRMKPNQEYHIKIVRKAHWLYFYVDNELHLEYFDPSPLFGKRNNRFAFNNWKSEVFFDNLEITAYLE